ncbi:MAG: aminopeptidase [Candidatus Firestonebacteria bacterium]|nr:aminopeptidase [Candidatus Firestonebacteria bacterium]
MPKEKKSSKKTKASKIKHWAFKPKSAWEQFTKNERLAAEAYAEKYKRFLGHAKTERECVVWIEKELKFQGFKPLEDCQQLKSGQRVYKNIKGRALAVAVIGKNLDAWRLVGAHVDSPRLDLKPNPLFEDSSLALLQTHYYGGIKKYHWVNLPLSLHAVVHTRQGVKQFVIGEKIGEPQFLIPDMPPHLAREQMDKQARKVVEGENMRVLVANRPFLEGEETEKVKAAVLEYLHREYGMVERDLLSADVSFVPAAKPVDVGFDRALVAAYGQDDRACAFGVLEAVLGLQAPRGVAVGLFVDKEEIGSDGDTGAQSQMLENFAAEILRKLGVGLTVGEVLEKAAAISADVTEALNPNFKEISDARNCSVLGNGISVEKYGGGGGKYDTQEASGEFMSGLVSLLDEEKIPWQTGELGRLDLGGGGTIAKFFSRYGMDAIDAGPPLLSMHSPQEISSKADLYAAFRCYAVFLKS